ncbi:GNAT family N-acetyltransferase [Deinococcus deserti]|uniref:Putative acetyltransferase n=1 Tax=Deinococcus deserti (strain DSM 17065 / CIP 109153 / LMG 22923 / VCD115) TaxID=546414 RepID=C1CZF8_DEIDV|nr:GNAT family N-acetyltransferase [Deinococcus deserti]ACO47206.1 putative acetyltransferase [Deinococcus deserti VCD115]
MPDDRLSDSLLQVRLLDTADAAVYREVRLSALRSDPLAFLTTADEFAARSLDSVADRLTPSDTATSFGAFLDGHLVGLLTLAREKPAIFAHRVNVFGVSVLSSARGRGCGDALMRAALTQAMTWAGVTSLHLAVMDTQHAARRLYERHGFTVWGTQPDAVRRDGQVLSEHWMWRALQP